MGTKTQEVKIDSVRQSAVAEQRAELPQGYRANYDKAVAGTSLRAAVNAFCLECTKCQPTEIKGCTSLACPLYSVRPYQDGSQKSEQLTPMRKAAIGKRRSAMPRTQRKNYDKAIAGISLRCSVDARCMECVYWKHEDVRRCTALACPLYSVRPHQDGPQNAHGQGISELESTNSVEGVSNSL